MLAPVDIEGALVVLFGDLTDEVATSVPNERPTGPYIRVTRIGGTSRNLIQSAPRVLVECWHDDETSAFNLARGAWARLWAAQDSFVGSAYLTAVDSSEPVNFPDPDTDSSRYQFITTITTSLEAIA